MKRKLSLLSLAHLGLMVALILTLSNSTSAQNDRFAGRTITGTAYFFGGRTAARTVPFKLIINHTGSSQDMSQLNAALQSGQDELLKSLSKMDAGRIVLGSGVGLTANAIFVTDEGDGRTKLTVLYERNLRFAEVRYGSRSENYRFGYAELYIGRGNHEGMLIPAAFIRLKDGNTWEVEDFGTYPARLMGLQVSGGGRGNAR